MMRSDELIDDTELDAALIADGLPQTDRSAARGASVLRLLRLDYGGFKELRLRAIRHAQTFMRARSTSRSHLPNKLTGSQAERLLRLRIGIRRWDRCGARRLLLRFGPCGDPLRLAGELGVLVFARLGGFARVLFRA